jgi:hypothetical protein
MEEDINGKKTSMKDDLHGKCRHNPAKLNLLSNIICFTNVSFDDDLHGRKYE